MYLNDIKCDTVVIWQLRITHDPCEEISSDMKFGSPFPLVIVYHLG